MLVKYFWYPLVQSMVVWYVCHFIYLRRKCMIKQIKCQYRPNTNAQTTDRNTSLATPICSTKNAIKFLSKWFGRARIFNIYHAYHIHLYAFIYWAILFKLLSKCICKMQRTLKMSSFKTLVWYACFRLVNKCWNIFCSTLKQIVKAVYKH